MMSFVDFYRPTIRSQPETVIYKDHESIELPSLGSSENDKLFKNTVSTNALRTKRTSKPSLFVALCQTYMVTFVTAGFLKLINDLLNFVGPQILKLDLISTVSNDFTVIFTGC